MQIVSCSARAGAVRRYEQPRLGGPFLYYRGPERKRLRVSFTRPGFVLHYRGFGPVSRHLEPETTRRNKNEFRSERGYSHRNGR